MILFFGRDRACEVDGSAVEEELFGQCRLTRVGVGDDGKCTAWLQSDGFLFIRQRVTPLRRLPLQEYHRPHDPHCLMGAWQ